MMNVTNGMQEVRPCIKSEKGDAVSQKTYQLAGEEYAAVCNAENKNQKLADIGAISPEEALKNVEDLIKSFEGSEE